MIVLLLTRTTCTYNIWTPVDHYLVLDESENYYRVRIPGTTFSCATSKWVHKNGTYEKCEEVTVVR